MVFVPALVDIRSSARSSDVEVIIAEVAGNAERASAEPQLAKRDQADAAATVPKLWM